MSSTPSACTSPTGTISVTTATGVLPITYSINGTNFQSGQLFNGLSPKVYTVTSKDANNIITTATIAVATANGPSIDATSTVAGCTVLNGTITANAVGGTTPYTYILSNGLNQNNGKFVGLKSGTYTIKVADVNGCSDQQIVTIPLSGSPSISLSATDAGCSIKNWNNTASASNGTQPYNFRLDNDPYQQNSNFTNVASGTYKVQVADANGCTAYRYIAVSTSVGPSISADFVPADCRSNNGSITISGSDGTSPYNYQLNGGSLQSSNNFAGLASGNYNISVIDANGCSVQRY